MFYDNGLKFECNKCSACCRLSPGYVYLSQNDLTRLCDCFKLSKEEFINKYCRWVQYYGNREALALIELKNYDCIFWNKDTGCTAYLARPVQCSTYPFWSWIIKDKESWDKEQSECPGINHGKLWTKEQIEKSCNDYVNNIPITREIE